jgi:hypothetical protein
LRGLEVVVAEPAVGNAGMSEEEIAGLMCHLEVGEIFLEEVADVECACRLES